MEKDLNQEEDIKDETSEGESDEDLSFLDEEEKESPKDAQPQKGEQDASALEIFNKKVGKNYKSWEDVAKSEKQRDIEFAQKGKEKPEKVVDVNLSERLLRVEKPESQFVIDEIKKDNPGQDPYEIWNKSEYYQKESLVRAEKERNKERISNPSGNPEGQPKKDPMSEKFKKNFPPGVEAAMKKQGLI
jgi:hypothetical protein